MLRQIYFVLLLNIVCVFGQSETDIILKLLPGTVDSDPAGIQYLLDIFPRDEIDFSELDQEDLDRLFFLSTESRAVLWKNRNAIKTLGDIDNLPIASVEKELLKLCYKEEKGREVLKLYGNVRQAEENDRQYSYSPITRLAYTQKFFFGKENWKLALSLQKDKGENIAIDSYNGYVAYQNRNVLVGTGNYFFTFGEGIVSSRPVFTNYKTSVNAGSGVFVRPYYGTDEINPQRGMFLTAKYGKVILAAAWSGKYYDADVNNEMPVIKTSGYHRAESEMKIKNSFSGQVWNLACGYRTANFTWGGIVNYTRFPQSYKFMGNSFFARQTQISFWFRLGAKNGVSLETKVYPSFSAVGKGVWGDKKRKIDIRLYFYGNNPSFSGRHIIFNTLAYDAKGVNIRFMRSVFGELKSGGYVFYERRMRDKRNRLYGGVYFDTGNHLFTFSFKQYALENQNPESRFDVQYRLELKERAGGRFILTAGMSSSGLLQEIRSRYLSLRYRLRFMKNFMCVFNMMGWTAVPGERVWLYTDGLPESFALLNTSHTGTFWNILLRYRVSSVEFFYLFGKQHNFAPQQDISIDRYRTNHQFGIRLTGL